MRIVLQTEIEAPVERCFDLARSIDFHIESARATQESAVEGVTTGRIGGGQEVEWRAKHFGLWWNMRVRITAFHPPHFFQDRIVKGPFLLFTHDHTFTSKHSATLMTDLLYFQSPIPVLGWLIDRLVLRKYLRTFLRARNIELKAHAEAERWHNS